MTARLIGDYPELPTPTSASDRLAAAALGHARDERDALIGWLVEVLAPVEQAEAEFSRGHAMGYRERLFLHDELRLAVRKYAAGVGEDTDLRAQRIAFARGQRRLP